MVTTIVFKHWLHFVTGLIKQVCSRLFKFSGIPVICRWFFKWWMCEGSRIMISILHFCHPPFNRVPNFVHIFSGRGSLLTCRHLCRDTDQASDLIIRGIWVLLSCYHILVSNLLDNSVKAIDKPSVFNLRAWHVCDPILYVAQQAAFNHH